MFKVEYEVFARVHCEIKGVDFFAAFENSACVSFECSISREGIKGSDGLSQLYLKVRKLQVFFSKVSLEGVDYCPHL